MNSEIEFQQVKTNGIELHVAMAGDVDGRPVFLLHGFPEAWFGWETQIHALADAGFRVIAPDQRGYNLSDKPEGIKAYHLDELAADIIGLANTLGYDQFCLAGHDWGASVAWWLGLNYPERIMRLAALNVPHPAVMQKRLRSDFGQMRRSWYVLAFQLPKLPEMGCRSRDWRAFIGQLPDAAAGEHDRYREAWNRPGAITGMLNWYRGLRLNPVPKTNRVTPPTLVIWGRQDAYLKQEMADECMRFCDDGRVVYIDEATHWVMQDAPEQVNQLLIDHFSQEVSS